MPLFLSVRQMRDVVRLKPRTADYAVDGGGFQELFLFGKYTISAQEYADELNRWRDVVGPMEWAPVQDWMCEEIILRGGVVRGHTVPGTGLTVRAHQERTIESWHELRAIDGSLPWAPVLQGQRPEDYLRHAELWESSGVCLGDCGVVGVGSVCRRNSDREIAAVFGALKSRGLKLHGFGVKTSGIATLSGHLHSADSMVWSDYARRYSPPLPGCRHGKNGTSKCNNCPLFALDWRQKFLARLRGRDDDDEVLR